MDKTLVLTLAVAMSPAGRADFVRPEIIPTPSSLEFDAKTGVSLDAETRVVVLCPEAGGGAWVSDRWQRWFAARPKVSDGTTTRGGASEDAYRLTVAPGEVRIESGTLRGVKYAMRSLRQTAMPARGGLKVRGWIVPAMTIDDAPLQGFRGIHILWTPDLAAKEVEKKIRLAAAYKFRYVILESWGVLRSAKLPWYAGSGQLDEQEARRLRSVADDEGIAIVPLFNVFGHAAGARSRSGKHVVLDAAPEYQPLFEPRGGWNWCLSNPETLKVQATLAGELLDWFGNHGYLHVGCDEPDKPSCPECNSGDYSRLYHRHLGRLRDVFAEKGVRLILWHDRIVDWTRWSARDDMVARKELEGFPRDVIVDFWCYGDERPESRAYPQVDFLRSLGFTVLMSPWEGKTGIAWHGEYAREHKLGILGTTWHRTAGWPMADIFAETACAAWGTSVPDAMWYERCLLAVHWRHVCWDMGLTGFRDTGFSEDQVSRSMNGE